MSNDYSKQFLPVLELALEEAKRTGSRVIMPEHFMLAALRDRDGVAYKIISRVNVDIDKVIEEIEEALRQQPEPQDTTTLFDEKYAITLSGVRFLQLATSEARKMNMRVIGSEHLFMALVNDKNGMDSEILRHIKEEYFNFNITIQRAVPRVRVPYTLRAV